MESGHEGGSGPMIGEKLRPGPERESGPGPLRSQQRPLPQWS
jgi:hypothetical protein